MNLNKVTGTESFEQCLFNVFVLRTFGIFKFQDNSSCVSVESGEEREGFILVIPSVARSGKLELSEVLFN